MDTDRHVQKLGMVYLENQRTGNLMSILNADINLMERFLNGGANQINQVFCSSVMVGRVFFALLRTGPAVRGDRAGLVRGVRGQSSCHPRQQRPRGYGLRATRRT